MRRSVTATIAVLACLAFGGAAVGASPPPDLLASFSNDHARGHVLADNPRNPDMASKVHFALRNLVPSHRYRLIFSTDPCSVPVASAQRIGRVWIQANAKGAAFGRSIVDAADYTIWRNARSVRLMEEEGIYYFCVQPRQLEAPSANEEPTGLWSAFRDGSHRGLVIFGQSGNDQVNVRTALGGLTPHGRYRIVHSPLNCAQLEEGDPDQPIVVGSFMADANGMSFRNRTETVDNNETITVGSNRIERVSSGSVWSCADVHLF